ncbi:MAG: hypothetical protein M1482_06785 [Chloroflexi bacterium]|nr:hypothetical protein [Chloroflexota bacterium]
MDALLSLLKSTVGSEQAQALVLFLVFLPPFFFAYWAVKRGMRITLRPITAYETLKRLLAQAAEAGRPVHLSLGIAGIGKSNTSDTMAGLTVLDYVADRAAISASPPIVTLADPTALPVAQDLLRRAYSRHGYPEEYQPARARFVAPDPLLGTGQSPNPALYASGQIDGFPYAAGTLPLLDPRTLIANVMIGQFGDEFLLLAETGANRHLEQIGGTSTVGVLPFVYTSVAHPLFGEEIYAGGAYLADKPAHLSSLLAQDIMRWFVIVIILAAVALRATGWI